MRDSQQKSDGFESFLRRSDSLAAKIRCGIDDLSEVIGISRASLYGYRKGQRKVSNKAWAKLEAAEREAGLLGDDGSGKTEMEKQAVEKPSGAASHDLLLKMLDKLPADKAASVAEVLLNVQLDAWSDELHSFWLEVGGAMEAMKRAEKELAEGEAKSELSYFRKELEPGIKKARKIWEGLVEVLRQQVGGDDA